MKNQKTGKYGEQLALEYLEKLGQKLVVKNFRYKKLGEIDIVTNLNNKLHFVEVKTRKNDNYGFPFEAVDYKKLEKIIKVAEVFRDQNSLTNLDYQFDIVSITLNPTKIEYFENVTM
ncbi:MAG: YraN family protein [bacterium]|nr:YraN family protein [bacterium]